jgi:hypothetical protein
MFMLHLLIDYVTEKSLRDAIGASLAENILLVMTPARTLWSFIPAGELPFVCVI